MGQITISLNGRSYRLSCGDGEEDRLRELADYVCQRIDELAGDFKQVGDDRLLVMAALMVTDELFDAREALGLSPGARVRRDDFEREGSMASPSDFFATASPDFATVDAAEAGDAGSADSVVAAPAPRTPVARRDTRRSDGRASLEERLAEARNKASAYVADRK